MTTLQSGRRMGFTLVEVAVAAAILVLLVPMAYLFATNSRDSWSVVEARSALTYELRKGLGEVSRRMLNGGRVTVQPATPNDSLTFQVPLAVTDSGTTWGAEGMLGWNYSLRVDSSDRLVLEVLDGGGAQQGETPTLATGIRPATPGGKGLAASLQSGRVRLSLTGTREMDDRTIDQTVLTEVFLRNEIQETLP